METLKALAAIFEIDFTSLTEDKHMTKDTEEISTEENKALQQVKEVKGFYTNLIQFVVIVSALAFINHMTSPGHYWIVWVIIGWGAGIIAHALTVFEVFNLFGVQWEKKQVEK